MKSIVTQITHILRLSPICNFINNFSDTVQLRSHI